MTPECGTHRQRKLPLALLTAGTVVGLVTALVAPTAAIATPASTSEGSMFVVLAIVEEDLDGDGVLDRRQTVTEERTTRGVVLSSSTVTVNLATDVVEVYFVEHRSYDDAGRLSLSTLEIGTGDTALSIEYQSFTYDARGTLIRSVQQRDIDANGTIDSVSTNESAGDERGLLTVQRFGLDFDGDGVNEQTTVITSTFDRRGNQLENLTESDTNGDGTIDQTTLTTTEYSARGQVIVQTTTDSRPSGISVLQTTTDYNSRGLFSRSQSYRDGLLDSEQSATYTARGTLASSTVAVDVDRDGVFDLTSVSDYVYNAQGEQVELSTSTRDADGTLRSATIYTREFDRRGNEVLYVETSDRDGDGTIDSVVRTTIEWDARGFAVKDVTEQDVDADGFVDSVVTSRFLVSRDGTLLQQIQEFDDDADGAVDRSTTFIYPRV